MRTIVSWCKVDKSARNVTTIEFYPAADFSSEGVVPDDILLELARLPLRS